MDYVFSIIVGDFKEFKKVKEIIFDYIEKLKKEGLLKEEFERIKKKKIGLFIKCFDFINFIGNSFIFYVFKDINLLEYLDVIKDIIFEEVEERLKEYFKEEYCVIFIVEFK